MSHPITALETRSIQVVSDYFHFSNRTQPSSTILVCLVQELMRASLISLARSAWKGPYFTAFPNLAEALQTNTAIRTSARACTILPNFVGLKLLVHNGKEYIPVNITPQMVGHKLGEFSPTRKRFTYKASKNR